MDRLQQGGSSNYGSGRQLSENAYVTAILKSFSGSPSLDRSGGNWFKNAVPAYLYSTLPDYESRFLPWGQPDVAQTADYGTQRWAPVMLAGIYGPSSTETKYWNHWQRTVTRQYTPANLISGANSRLVPFAMIYLQESDPQADYKRAYPHQRAFTSVDGDPGYALQAWISRTGWSSSNDTLVFATAMPSSWTTDHIGKQPAGAYKIYKKGWLLTEDGPHHTGAAADSNMPLFGGGGADAPVRLTSIDGNQSDDTNNAYTFVRINMAPAYARTATATRALRYLIHFKKAGTQEYIVAYDDLASSSGTSKTVNLYFDKTPGEASAMTSSSAPSLVWTGPNRRLSTAVVLPETTALVSSYAANLPYSHKVSLCASRDGVTCDATNTSCEFLMVHRPSNSVLDGMPFVSALETIESGFLGVQIAGADPKVAVFPRSNASARSVGFRTSHPGSAQVFVTGLASGTYDFRRDGDVICGAVQVASTGGLYCESPSGGIRVIPTGSP